MSKPKIVIFVTSYRPFIGGAEVAVQEITRRLKDHFTFYIVTSRLDRRLPRREMVEEGAIVRIGFGSRFDKYLLPFACTRLSRVQSSAVVGVDLSHASVAAALYKIFHPSVPFIFNIQFGESENRLASGRGGIIAVMFRFILGRTDHVTAISSYLLDLARRYGYQGSATVIPNGVDTEKFKVKSLKSKVDEKKIVITTSRLVYKNAIDVLIKAVAEAKKAVPNIQCWIIGEGPERKALESQVLSLNLQENVKLLGSISNENIPDYLHKADVFVRASRSEGMGISFVEALAAGLPIIGTKVGGITDIIEDGETGLFADTDNPRDLAKKIAQLLQDQALADKIVRQGKKLVERNFSWDTITDSYQTIFSQMQSVQRGRLHILVATPLLPPQLGGPALYAKNLCEEFQKSGHRVVTVSFNGYLAYPSGIRHVLYFFALLREVWRSDVIFALDYTSVGLPAAVVSVLFRKPMIIRVEGDFLWEKFVERTHHDVTLSNFYRTPQSLTVKEKFIKSLSRWVLCRAAKLIFSSEWRRNMIIEAYGIPRERTGIVRNVFLFHHKEDKRQRRNIILWAGRMLYLKNLYRFIDSFAAANDGSWELHLVGDGFEKESLKFKVESLKLAGVVHFFDPLSREKLLEKMAQSAFFVLPSLSDVGPNVIADAVSVGTPFIMTKESGYLEYVKDVGMFVDPLNEKNIAEKIKTMMDENIRKEYQKKVEQFSGYREWEESSQEWLTILYESTRNR